MNKGLIFSQKWLATLAESTFFQNAFRPLIAPKIVYLKDVKPSGTLGGTFTSGAWQTRDLNVVDGDSEIVSLSGNQFTLQAGEYEIEATAPSYRTSKHKIKLFNVTDSVDMIIGGSSFSGNETRSSTSSSLKGVFKISQETILEIQHRSEITFSAGGLGIASSFGVDEVYTEVKITKLY